MGDQGKQCCRVGRYEIHVLVQCMCGDKYTHFLLLCFCGMDCTIHTCIIHVCIDNLIHKMNDQRTLLSILQYTVTRSTYSIYTTYMCMSYVGDIHTLASLNHCSVDRFVQCKCTHMTYCTCMFNCTEFAEGGFSDDEGYTKSDDDTCTCAMVSSSMAKNVLFMFSVLVGVKWTSAVVLKKMWSRPRHQVICVMVHTRHYMEYVSGIQCTSIHVTYQKCVKKQQKVCFLLSHKIKMQSSYSTS